MDQLMSGSERSGWVTRDRGDAGSSLTGVTALCPWERRSTGSTQEDLSLHNWKIVDETLRIKSNKLEKN